MKASGDQQRGLTLIELMVSMAISVAVLSSLVYVYVGSRAAYRANDALARVQETGRFALEFIARDLRQAGFMGCVSRDADVTVYANPSPAWAISLKDHRGIYGFEKAAGFTYPKTVERLPDDKQSDVVEIIALDPATRAYIAGSDVNKATIDVADNCPVFNKGNIVVATDCARAVVVTLTKVTPSPLPATNPPCKDVPTLEHDAGNNAGFQKQSGAFVARFGGDGAVTYFIGRPKLGPGVPNNAPPSLYRMGSGDINPERVAENVEDLDFLYGVDTDDNGAVDAYLPADQIAVNQWRRVLSVRVSVVAVSAEAAKNLDGGKLSRQVIYVRDTTGDTVADAQDAGNKPSDPKDVLRLRQVFTTTVALRNRLP